MQKADVKIYAQRGETKRPCHAVKPPFCIASKFLQKGEKNGEGERFAGGLTDPRFSRGTPFENRLSRTLLAFAVLRKAPVRRRPVKDGRNCATGYFYHHSFLSTRCSFSDNGSKAHAGHRYRRT